MMCPGHGIPEIEIGDTDNEDDSSFAVILNLAKISLKSSELCAGRTNIAIAYRTLYKNFFFV